MLEFSRFGVREKLKPRPLFIEGVGAHKVKKKGNNYPLLCFSNFYFPKNLGIFLFSLISFDFPLNKILKNLGSLLHENGDRDTSFLLLI